MSNNDWLFADQKQEITTEQKKAMYEMQQAYVACFATPAGKKVLENMRALTVEQPSLTTYQQDGVNTAISMAYREGANAFVRHVLNTVKQGEANND